MKHGSNGIRKSFEQRSRATKRPPFPLEVVILSCASNLQFNLFFVLKCIKSRKKVTKFT